MQRSTTAKCLLRSGARRTEARWMSSAPGQSGPQEDAPPTPAPRRSGARLGTWAEIDSRHSFKASSEAPFTPSLDWIPQTSNPTTFAQRQVAARRQQLAQQAPAKPKAAPAPSPAQETSAQPKLDLSNIVKLASRAKNTPHKARQQQLEAASASVDPVHVRPPRELLARRSDQTQQPRQPKQKKQRSGDNRKPARGGAPKHVSANELPKDSAAEEDKFDLLPEAQADGVVKRLQLETNLDALFGSSAPPAQPPAPSESGPAANAAPVSPPVPTPRVTQFHGAPYMSKRRLMEQFGGRYSRFLPDKVVAASLASKKRDPLAYARLTLARSRDVGLGRRKVALELMDAAAASPTSTTSIRA